MIQFRIEEYTPQILEVQLGSVAGLWEVLETKRSCYLHLNVDNGNPLRKRMS